MAKGFSSRCVASYNFAFENLMVSCLRTFKYSDFYYNAEIKYSLCHEALYNFNVLCENFNKQCNIFII
jgi:hypothetical protein